MADNMILVLTDIMLTLFIVCIIGYIARKIGIIDNTFSKKLSTLIIKVAQPFLIITSIINTEYTNDNLKLGLLIIGVGLLCHTAMAIVAKLYIIPIKNFNEKKMTEFTMIFANAGFMGLPVLGAMFGEKGLFCGAFYQVAFNLFLWSYGMIILGSGRDDIKINPKQLLLNFGTTPCIIGVLLYVLKPYFAFPEFATDAFTYLGSLCTPISQLIIGGLIATRPLISLFNSWKKYVFSFVNLIATPLLAALVCRLLHLDEFMTYFITVMTSLPCATNSAMFGEMYDIEPEQAAQTVGVTTILSVVTIPVVIYITGFLMKI